MEEYDKQAINSVKAWLVHCLNKEDWCKAKVLGKALEMLVDMSCKTTGQPTVRAMAEVGEAERPARY